MAANQRVQARIDGAIKEEAAAVLAAMGLIKRDYKRESKGLHRVTLDADLLTLVVTLANDQPLEPRHRAHVLIGGWKDHRDCQVKPDLVLNYRKPPDDSLQLVRHTAHSELGL